MVSFPTFGNVAEMENLWKPQEPKALRTCRIPRNQYFFKGHSLVVQVPYSFDSLRGCAILNTE